MYWRTGMYWCQVTGCRAVQYTQHKESLEYKESPFSRQAVIMVTPCQTCQQRKQERKLRRELAKLKKDNKQSKESNEMA